MPEPSIRLRWLDAVLDTDDPGIDAYAIAVAAALRSHMSTDGRCRPSTRRLATLARCSRTIVIDRLRRLETVGLLTVDRRRRAVSSYRADIPTGQPGGPDVGDDDWSTGPPHGPDGGPDDGCADPDLVHLSADLVHQVNSEPVEPVTPTSRDAVTHEDPPPVEEPKGKITPKRILTEMARRKLGLAREQNAEWAPPEGCDPRRESGWLAKEFDALRAQHGFELDAMIARLHPEHAAQPKHADPDYYVWRLDPTLARRDWGIRNAAETHADLERDRAERAASLATPEQRERNRQGREAALALQARLRAERAAHKVPA